MVTQVLCLGFCCSIRSSHNLQTFNFLHHRPVYWSLKGCGVLAILFAWIASWSFLYYGPRILGLSIQASVGVVTRDQNRLWLGVAQGLWYNQQGCDWGSIGDVVQGCVGSGPIIYMDSNFYWKIIFWHFDETMEMKHVSKLNHGCLVYGVVYVANTGIFSGVFCRRVHDKWRSVYMECIIHWLYLFQIPLVFSHHLIC